MALANPLLDFDDLLFVKRVPGSFTHMSDKYYGWFSRPGGGLYVLEGFKTGQPRRCLTEKFPPGSALRPDLSYDGKRALFAWCTFHPDLAGQPDKLDKSHVPEDAFYHLYEVHLDGTGLRRLTHGKYDDFDGRYLPDGRDRVPLHPPRPIRPGQSRDDRSPAGWGRRRSLRPLRRRSRAAGRGLHAPRDGLRRGRSCPALSVRDVRVDAEHRPGRPHPLLAVGLRRSLQHALHEALGHDARRDRSAGRLRQLHPQSALRLRGPGGSRIAQTDLHRVGAPRTDGRVARVVGPAAGTDGDGPMQRLTPEVCFPESEGWPQSYFAGPWPLSEEHYLVSWSDRPLPPGVPHPAWGMAGPPNDLGLYLFDAFGNLNLLYRDAMISSETPIPVKPRTRPLQSPRHAQGWP